jgi:hypothetical protein
MPLDWWDSRIKARFALRASPRVGESAWLLGMPWEAVASWRGSYWCGECACTV